MCGIVGWLSLDAARPARRDVVMTMRDRMIHRGPDGSGEWLSPRGRIALGFRRLAIIDLNASANQPMTNEDGSLWIVFNGEIYNHAKLRPELIALGHTFRTDHSDTETLLHAFEEWGPQCLHRLEGMFGFAVWNERTGKLFVARDRVGVKPVYFATLQGGFLFASEIKAIVAHPDISVDVEPLALYHYLSFMTTPAPLTMFKGIYKMPAGHYLTIDASTGRMSAVRYWDALPNPDERGEVLAREGAAREKYCVDRTRTLLLEAVEKRTVSDVPIGAFLSGGIDSSAIVAMMSELTSKPVRTFTVGFRDHEELNELEYARMVSKRYGTDHHEVLVDEPAMAEYLPQLVHSQDEPIADWVCIPLYFVSKLARDSGTIVLQVGEGSDEQFCGYRGYMMHLDMYERYWRPYGTRVMGPARRVVSRVAELLSRVSDRHDRYLDIIIRAGLDREFFWSGATVFPEFRKQRLFHGTDFEPLDPAAARLPDGLLPDQYRRADSFGVVKSYFDRVDEQVPDADVLTRMIYSEFKLRLPELLLMRVDKIGMSVSIEPRVPFLDHKLIEFTMGIPMESKIKGGITKSILKQALRGIIPDEIIDRKKMGFGAPMVQWLRGKFGLEVEAVFRRSRFFERTGLRIEAAIAMLRDHREGRADHATYIWLIYNVVAWYDHWTNKSGLRDVA